MKVAGARCLDVYVGVDVFGRNCYGGGGFDSDKVRICTYVHLFYSSLNVKF